MKELKNEDVRIVFERMENGEKVSNCMQFYVNNHFNGRMYVSRNFGNWWYVFLKNNPWRISEDQIERIWLRHCIYNDDYDAYSDISKDVFGFRMRKTTEEWKRMVKEERAIYGS